MLSASAFGSVDNTYVDLDYSGYHKIVYKRTRARLHTRARAPQKVSNSRETKVLTDLLVTRTHSPIFENQFGD